MKKQYKDKLVLAAVLAVVVLTPSVALAAGNPILNVLNYILGMLTGGIVLAIAAIAVTIIFLSMVFGHFEARKAMWSIAGITGAFSAMTIVNLIATASGG